MNRNNSLSTSISNMPLAIDLFSGCGGLTEGLKQAGFNVIAAIENEKKASLTYKLNHPEVNLFEKDIRELNPLILMKHLRIIKGRLDLLAGCPPCQGFSRLQKKINSEIEDKNKLIKEFEKFVLALLPKKIMLENVPGLAKYDLFFEFIEFLKENNYDVIYQILDVSNYGVPQRRKRLILSANRKGKAIIAPPLNYRMTVRDAIQGLPNSGKSKDPLHNLKILHSKHVKDLIKNIPKNGGSRINLPKNLILACHKDFNGYKDVYGRMNWDDLSPTITSGCFNPSKGRFLHPEYNRAITLREASLLQGFPQDYKFDINHGKTAIALMIGNALPPPFIKQHAEKMLYS